jgi:hypothetical protein
MLRHNGLRQATAKRFLMTPKGHADRHRVHIPAWPGSAHDELAANGPVFEYRINLAAYDSRAACRNHVFAVSAHSSWLPSLIVFLLGIAVAGRR